MHAASLLSRFLRYAAPILLTFHAAGAASRRSPALAPLSLDVAGLRREARLHVPAGEGKMPAPVVFVFHGHGGSMANAARSFALHAHWPEALVVYPQGLPTPGQLTDPEGRRAGWQSGARSMGDRDLMFFDTLLAHLAKVHRVDRARVFATGHSNGGGFTYLLWAQRGDQLTAIAPSGAAARRNLRNARLQPLPVMHIAGRADPLVKFAWQEFTLATVRRVNGVAEEGTPWGGRKHAQIHKSESGTPLVTIIHPGGHRFPREAAPLIAIFFRDFAPPGTAEPATEADR